MIHYKIREYTGCFIAPFYHLKPHTLDIMRAGVYASLAVAGHKKGTRFYLAKQINTDGLQIKYDFAHPKISQYSI